MEGSVELVNHALPAPCCELIIEKGMRWTLWGFAEVLLDKSAIVGAVRLFNGFYTIVIVFLAAFGFMAMFCWLYFHNN